MYVALEQEWDAVMLETHQNRTALMKTRQELAHALYQQDAACRVIARCGSPPPAVPIKQGFPASW